MESTVRGTFKRALSEEALPTKKAIVNGQIKQVSREIMRGSHERNTLVWISVKPKEPAYEKNQIKIVNSINPDCSIETVY